MPHALQMTPQQKAIIIRMKDNGQSNREAAKHIGCNQSIVSKVYKRWKEERSVEVQKRSGRPRKSNEKMDRVIWRMSKKDRFKSANLIRPCLLKHYGLSLSSRTVRRRLNEGGLFGRSAQKKPFISLHNRRRRRLEWARQHVHFSVEDWKNVLFSDESKFVRVQSSGRVYVRCMVGEAHSIKCTRPTVQMGSDSVMIWGCFFWCGMGPMVELEGRVNAARYGQLIKNTVSPFMEKNMGRKGIFQQDNAPIHTAKLNSKIFKDLKMKVLDWLAQSPDLNPIENI